MKKKIVHICKFFILIISIAVFQLYSNLVLAQSKIAGSKITGTIVNESQKPLDYITVSLLKAKDTSLVKTSVTDLNGLYSFENVPTGDYLISAMMMGYRKTFSKAFEIDENSKQIIIPDQQLIPESKSLKEISVLAQRPQIERRMDKLIINVENSSLAAGSTAMEVLEKAPGVTVDKDDNISMKGKLGVLIMIDGKQTYMSSSDVANMLRNMQSDQIETIELIQSPSARYDAAGTSGIINIKTKKSKGVGLNGSLTAGAGYGETSKYNGGTIINYRKNKINAFGNYNFLNNGRLNTMNINRAVTYQDTLTNFSQINDLTNRRNGNSFKGGIDYFINKNNTIGILVNGYLNRNNEENTGSTFRKNNFNQSEIINVLGNNIQKYRNLAYNFNYKGTLDTTGKEISLDLDYSDYVGKRDEIRDNQYTRFNLQPRSNLKIKNYAPSKIEVKSIKLDYTHPLNKTTKLELGLKSSIVKTDNDLLFAKLNGSVFISDLEYTNHFLYDENINAAYVSFRKEIKNGGIQLGLRTEHTKSKGNSITKNQVVDRKYLEFFPSVSISQKLGKDHQLGLSYSRRIDRPGYDNLNPFVNFLDEYTYYKGNPFLNPQFTNGLDFSHTFKGGIITTLNYSYTKDMMTSVTEQDDATQRTYATQKNLDEQRIMGINLYAPVPISKWWNINNNVRVFYMKLESKSVNGNLNSSQTAVMYNMDNSFTINKSFTAEASLQYQSPMQYGIFKVESQTVFNVGLRKSFMNNKTNLRLSLSDVFNTRTQKLSTNYQNMDLNLTEKGESRIGRLTLSYRFGKNEIKAARGRSTGVEEETNRMKN